MKTIFSILILIAFAFVSCTPVKISPAEIQETGAWGPFVIETDSSASSFIIEEEKNPGEKIDFITVIDNKELYLYPLVGLKSGETYRILDQSNSKFKPLIIRVRKPCIVFISDPGGEAEINIKCTDAESLKITSTNGQVRELTISKTGDRIFFTILNNQGNSEIWEINPDGSGRKLIYDCMNSICYDLVFNIFSKKLAFIQADKNPTIKVMDLVSGEVTKLGETGSDLDFSPDGKYLSFLQNNTEQLVIINLTDLKHVSLQSGAGLVGEWGRDSQTILYGNLDYWGGIPGVRVLEYDLISGESKEILFDPNQDHEFFNPSYTGEEGKYFALTRTRNAGASKSFWFFNSDGEKIYQIKNDPLFHYSLPTWSPDYADLLFQRFPINTSKGNPQVMTWNRETGKEQLISDNAAQPYWLP